MRQQVISPIDGSVYTEIELASGDAIESILEQRGRGAAPVEACTGHGARRDLPPDGRADGRAGRSARHRAHLADRTADRADPVRDPAGFSGAIELHDRHRSRNAGGPRRRRARRVQALHPPRAARRRARAGALELSLSGLGECRDPRDHGGQHRHPEDGAADAARLGTVRGGVRGGGSSAGGVPVSAREPRGRRADHRGSADRVRLVHRVGGWRPCRAAGGQRPVHLGESRARRQGSRLRACRRAAARQRSKTS